MKRPSPLTEEEIEQAIRKIRHLYDDYIITFTKPFKLKNLFEDRYFEARKQRIDLTGFVFAELDVVQRLKHREEAKVAAEEEKRFKRITQRATASGLIERVAEEQRKQIEKYPDFEVDERASYEMKKLFGALDRFEKVFWPPFDRILRKIYPSYFSNPRVDLEPKIYALCCGPGASPPIASRYKALLLRLPKSANDVEWEEKRIILEAAFFLHQLDTVIRELLVEWRDELNEEELAAVENIREYVHIVIIDFRLKDLNPSNLGG